ncbi:MAG: extracellular solute-binding protein [Candidatus Shapirobacteria bacterium]|nr:extracellular solute-binding protein [Candidatus Shapirobacteria bacterium]
MSIDDIKSPLPPRRINIPLNPEKEMANSLPPIPAVSNPATPEPITPKPKFDPKLIKFGGIGLIALILLGVLIGIVIPKIKDGLKKEPVVVNYWGLWEDSNILEGIIADFESKNPGIKINYKMNQKNDYGSRLQGRLAKSGVAGEEVPDIYRIHQSWIPSFRDYLAPVPATTVKNIQLDTDFFDTYKEDLVEKGSYMAIPLMYDGLAMYYNKDLINAAQVELPKNWWDLETAANKLTVKDDNGNIKVAGVAMGLINNVDHWNDIIGLMMKQNGVNPLINDDANNKKLQDVLTFYTLFRTKDHVWDESLPSSTQLFANGKLAFYFAPSWRVFNIKDINKNLNFGIAMVPQLPVLDNANMDKNSASGKLTNIHWASYWVEGVNSKSTKQKEAWKFLEFMASQDTLEKMYQAASQTRDFGEIYPRKSMADKIADNSMVQPFVAAANNASGGYLSSRTFGDGLNKDMEKYFGDAINSIALDNNSAADIMVPLRNGLNQMIQKYQIQ